MENKGLQLVYIFFVGIMLAIFVGLGVETFYPSPEAPDYSQVDPGLTPGVDDEYEAYAEALEDHGRNVSIITTALAVIMMALSLLLEKRNRVLTNGIMLGGLITLVYGTVRSLFYGDTMTTFITVAVGLAVVIFLGYRRFGRSTAASTPPAAASDESVAP